MNHRWNKESLEVNSNIFSRIFFLWTSKLIALGGLNEEITSNHLFEVHPDEKFTQNFAKFQNILNDQIKNKKKEDDNVIMKSVKKLISKDVITGLVFLTISNLLQFAGPILLAQILKYLKDGNQTKGQGISYAIGILISFLLRGLFQQHGFHQMNKASFKIIASLEGLIYQKLMRLKCSSIQYVGTGKIVNLSTVDVMGIYGFTQFGSFLITSPIMIVVSLALIINEVGASGLMGIVMLFLGTMMSGKLGMQQIKIRQQSLKYSDQRAKMMTEYINGMRILKYQGWEQFAIDNIQTLRKQEAKQIFSQVKWRNGLDVVSFVIPTLISIAVFGVYVGTGNTLTPEKAFSTLGFFNLLSLPIRLLGFAVQGFINVQVNLKRINFFFGWADQNTEFNTNHDTPIGEVMINNGFFSWNTQEAEDYNNKYEQIFGKKGSKGPSGKSKENVKSKNESAKENQNKIQSQDEQKKNLNNLEVENEKKNLTILKNINIRILKGQFVGIIGKVGSGKSSLLYSLINEMNCQQGNLNVNPQSKLAFISQTAWLMSATLRDNILFGSDYNQSKYDEVIELCELKADLEQLPGGDLTEIGERGINLSGGQKQRVAIARALYSDADIYLIDDCLSALDNFVSNKIFKNVLQDKLKDKTRIFVTHALQFVNSLDSIYVMKEGEIVQNNTYDNLLKDGGEFANLLSIDEDKQKGDEQKNENQQNGNEKVNIGQLVEENMQNVDSEMQSMQDEQHSIHSSNVSVTNNNKNKKSNNFQNEQPVISTEQQEMVPLSKKNSTRKKSESQEAVQNQEKIKKEKGALLTSENRQSGKVKSDVYKFYTLMAGYDSVFFLFLLLALMQGALIFNDIWLGFWSTNEFNKTSLYYIIGYLIIGVASALCVFSKGMVFAYFIKRVAITLQKNLMNSIFRCTMGWFDVTPSGRILNRTNKDQDEIDNNLPWTLGFCLQNIFSLLGYFITVCIIFPYFIIIFIIICFFYIYTVNKYLKVAREVKRIESLKRAPALSLIGETSSGCIMIRSYKKQDIYMQMVDDKFSEFIMASSNNMVINRWISLYSDIFSSTLIGSAAILAVLSKDINYTSSQAFTGVALTNIFKVTGLMSFTIKILADTELAFNAVERCKEYIDNDVKEAEWLSPPMTQQDWPQTGHIVAKNLYYKYRSDTPIVIKGISFTINPYEKVGVVGRTGSGKSTLTLGLLRILELHNKEHQDSCLEIDGVDISGIGLHHLRQKLSIIPQDPFLFTGTLRKNVDPFDEYTDQQVIDSLKAVTIWNMIGQQEERQISDNERLQWEISDGGSNFSLGQRQLICMSRSILRKSRVLIMDEATASIDEATDHLIQDMIQQQFQNTTVLTIAHRINTIITYDRLIIMDKGHIVQFDTPHALMLDKQGLFYQIVIKSGQEYYDQLMELINKS